MHPLLENLKLFKTWTFQNQHKGISLVTLLHFCFRIIVLKMLIFEVYLPIKKSLVTTLTETKSLKNSNYFHRTTSFRYRIVASKILIFEVYLPLKERFLWWNTSTHFQKICSCSRYDPSKVIQKTQITLVALICFCFRIIASKSSFLRPFYL